jgi:hypothetical protein
MTKTPFVLDDITKNGWMEGGIGNESGFARRNCREAA